MKPLILVTFIILILISTLAFLGDAESKNNAREPGTKDLKSNYAIFSVELPAEMEFAGERVPLDQMDIFESLDREILVNTYWQSQTVLFIKRANRYFPLIERILKKYNIPEDFKYLPVAESGLTNAISPAHAVGFWQLLAGTAREYGLVVNDEVDERYHIEKSTEAACKYLLKSYEKYGSWTMAAASYNAGHRGIDRQINRQKDRDYYDLLLYEETARYIFRILAFKLILSNPSDYGFHVGKNDLYQEIPYYEVTVDGGVKDFAEFAKRYEINYKILKWMNPWLRDDHLTNSHGISYFFKIPRKGYFDPGRVDSQRAVP
ncbi:MAG: lytic transglycosylase domain-containing protein [Bacteroidota bacterium]